MALTAKLKWQAPMAFRANVRGHEFFTDAKKESGGSNLGPNPKELLLTAICGCTGMDVVSLLKKFKEPFWNCEVSAESELTQGQPSVFKEIHLKFIIDGEENLNIDNVKKAVDLSMTRYCGVSAMVFRVSPIKYHIMMNGKEIGQGQADFKIESIE